LNPAFLNCSPKYSVAVFFSSNLFIIRMSGGRRKVARRKIREKMKKQEDKREDDILERSSILVKSVQGISLASHALYEHTNGHTRGEGVRVDDTIRFHSTL
jgi:hypothetical protein